MALFFAGHLFTWSRSLVSDRAVEEKLDRAFISSAWLDIFPDLILTNLIAHISDHTPILLRTEVLQLVASNFSYKFKYENIWLQEDSLHDAVMNSWVNSNNGSLVEQIQHCTSSLEHWSRNLHFNFRRDIKSCRRKLDDLQSRTDTPSIEQFNQLKDQLASLLVQEDCYWRQRAKAHWYRDGDANTKFFHATASAHKKINKLDKLVNDDGF